MNSSSKELRNKSPRDLRPDDSDVAESPVDSSENTSSSSNETRVRELGGPKGPEPTRFGDWERKGRCVDF